jgi:hypothetical protein
LLLITLVGLFRLRRDLFGLAHFLLSFGTLCMLLSFNFLYTGPLLLALAD